jgi:hypothetical protein
MKIKDLKKALRPKGKKDVVRLDLINHYFNYSFVQEAINQIQISSLVDSPLNPLEKLGAILLLDSAGYEPEEMK